ncbi:1505_t:CDS:2 [Entrophospora sp. SA101]|nr:1505_t:CDS:2 [Entrophospora sp. SA101]
MLKSKHQDVKIVFNRVVRKRGGDEFGCIICHTILPMASELSGNLL